MQVILALESVSEVLRAVVSCLLAAMAIENCEQCVRRAAFEIFLHQELKKRVSFLSVLIFGQILFLVWAVIKTS